MEEEDKLFIGRPSNMTSSDVAVTPVVQNIDSKTSVSSSQAQAADIIASDAKKPEQMVAKQVEQLGAALPHSTIKPEPPYEANPGLASNVSKCKDTADFSGVRSEKRKKDKRTKDSGASATTTVVKPRKKRKQAGHETAYGYPSPQLDDEFDECKPDKGPEYAKQPRKNKATASKAKKQLIKEANKVAFNTSPNSRNKVSNMSNASVNTRAKKAKKTPKVSATASTIAAVAPPTTATTTTDTPGSVSPSHNSTFSHDGEAVGCYSAAQNAVNDMMRRALEEDQYSALGSVVDTDSSDEDEYNAVLIPTLYSRKDSSHITALSDSHTAAMAPLHNRRSTTINSGSSLAAPSKTMGSSTTQTTYTRLDRLCLIQAMKKRARMEGIKHASTSSLAKSPHRFPGDASQTVVALRKTSDEGSLFPLMPSAAVMLSNIDFSMDSPAVSDDELAEDDDFTNKGGKKHRGGRRKRGSEIQSDDEADALRQEGYAGGTNTIAAVGSLLPVALKGVIEGNIHEEEEEEEEETIFSKGKNAPSNATWVQCDRCKKWRRLRGVVDAKKLNLPTKWYCSMNKNDPERSKCTAPEEEYDSALITAPETAADQRTRVHLRVWARRLQCNEAYEAKLPTMTRQKKKSTSSSAKEPYEWIRCCNPSCGKWRAILKFMDKQAVMDGCKNGEWYCVQNTWDEKMASCAAPQENLPAIGCPLFCYNEE